MKLLGILLTIVSLCCGWGANAKSTNVVLDKDQRYSDIAVDGDLVYLAQGSKGLLVYSQAQGKVIAHLSWLEGRKVYADQVQVVGHELFVYGQRHLTQDLYGVGRETRDFWIDVFDIKSMEHMQSVRIDLMEALEGPDVLVDLPNMVGQYDEAQQQFYVSFVHIKNGSFLWTLQRPDSPMTEYKYGASHTVEFLPAANQFAIWNDVIYVGTGRGELYEVAPGTGEAKMLASDLGYLVDVVKVDEELYLADYNGRMLRYDLQQEKIVEELPSRNGFVSALDVTPSCAAYLLLDGGFVKITKGKK